MTARSAQQSTRFVHILRVARERYGEKCDDYEGDGEYDEDEYDDEDDEDEEEGDEYSDGLLAPMEGDNPSQDKNAMGTLNSVQILKTGMLRKRCGTRKVNEDPAEHRLSSR